MCDECCPNYIHFPSMIFGGVKGSYFLTCPVTSCKWAEYKVLSIANSTIADAFVVVSGDSAPVDLSYVVASSQQLNDMVFLRGQAFFATFETGRYPVMPWQRITDSQKRIFMNLDNGAGVTYVTVQFRARILDVVPGPSPTIHPDLEQQMNIERERTIEKRLASVGIPKKAIEEHGR